MKRLLPTLGLLLSAAWAVAAEPSIPTTPGVAFSLIKTSHVTTREAFTYDGGSYFKSVPINHMAVLVRHGDDSFLFDTGLGKHIDEQYKDMPFWATFFFRYEHPVSPARTQLDQAGYGPISKIILSHSHWDHASGLVDFPEAEVWVTPEELAFLKQAKAPGNFPSEVASPGIHWHNYGFEKRTYEGFAQSLDIYHDGSAVLVPLPGHTPGSVGLFLTTASGKRFFFCGDLVWNASAFANGGAPKAPLASRIVDHDRPETLKVVQQVVAIKQAEPGLTIIPAHDATVQAALGYFPHWVQ